jgi:hypothetical protein
MHYSVLMNIVLRNLIVATWFQQINQTFQNFLKFKAMPEEILSSYEDGLDISLIR